MDFRIPSGATHTVPERIIATPAAVRSLWCATCDQRSPRWPGFPQCFGCLFDHVLPCDVVPKYIVGFDADSAAAEFRWFRGAWEEQHPGFELLLDRQRLFPEESPPSKHADRETSLGRKLFYCRWLVVRRHEKLNAPACAASRSR